jgi:hypothetical protein
VKDLVSITPVGISLTIQASESQARAIKKLLKIDADLPRINPAIQLIGQGGCPPPNPRSSRPTPWLGRQDSNIRIPYPSELFRPVCHVNGADLSPRLKLFSLSAGALRFDDDHSE